MAKMIYYKDMTDKKVRGNLYFFLQALQGVKDFEIYLISIKPLLSSFQGVEVDDKHIPIKKFVDETDIKYLDTLSIIEIIEICIRRIVYIYSNNNTEMLDERIDSFLNVLSIKFLSRQEMTSDEGEVLDIAQRLSAQLGLD